MDTEVAVPRASGKRSRIDLAFFIVASFAQLLPVWMFRFVPTQDGPSHLYNAVILKDYSKPGRRYREFFDLRREPLPNWTSHLVLAGLLHITSPIIAEKLLASIYVIGLAWSFRYFANVIEAEVTVMLVGLLLVFNRCFLMGFYNYCLSLVIFFLVLGFYLRSYGGAGARNSTILAGLLLLCYFTHLVGWALSVISVLWIAVVAPAPRLRRLLYTACAIIPSACLAMWFVSQSAFLSSPGVAPAEKTDIRDVRKINEGEYSNWYVNFANQGLFGTYESPNIRMGFIVLLFLDVLVILRVFWSMPRDGASKLSHPRLWVVGLGFLFGILYILLPDYLGKHGGSLKTRLVMLPPLLWIVCLTLPVHRAVQAVVKVAACLLIALNLVLVGQYFHSANQDLESFISAGSRVGCNRTLLALRRVIDRSSVDPLLHAQDYCCLETGNIDLLNYEAVSPNFPVRFRPEILERCEAAVRKGRMWYPADIVLVPGRRRAPPPQEFGAYCEIYTGASLSVFERAAQ